MTSMNLKGLALVSFVLGLAITVATSMATYDPTKYNILDLAGGMAIGIAAIIASPILMVAAAITELKEVIEKKQ